ncbi:MAG: hypothetical protein ACE141_02030 [Bryobacteraceae bacterium]
MRKLTFVFALAIAHPGWAQFGYPASASTILYFAQLADGGQAVQKWTTTITFTNPNTTVAASVRVSFYGDGGQPWSLDFGQGASSTLNLTVPAGGVRSMSSTGAAATMTWGWGIATSSSPVSGVVLYRATVNGNPYWDVAAVGTGSTFHYNSYANANLGVALANPNSQPLHLRVVARDDAGLSRGVYLHPELPAKGHNAFNVGPVFSSLPPGFSGSITIEPVDDPPLPFVAWTLNARDDLVSPLPSGEMVAPGPYSRRPYDIARKVLQGAAAVQLVYDGDAQRASFLAGQSLVIDPDTTIKATFDTTDNSIHLSASLIEAMGDSDSALAFLIGHRAFRAMCSRYFPGEWCGTDDADIWSELYLISTGYDPAGAADFWGRLVYANMQGVPIDSALRVEFSLPNGMAARLQPIWDEISHHCRTMDPLWAYNACATARKYWHPHYPANTP